MFLVDFWNAVWGLSDSIFSTWIHFLFHTKFLWTTVELMCLSVVSWNAVNFTQIHACWKAKFVFLKYTLISHLLCVVLPFFFFLFPFTFLVQAVWFLSSVSLQRISAGRTTAGMTLIGDALSAFVYRIFTETHEAWQSNRVMLLPAFEKLPKKSDWNWPVVFILLFARDRFGGLNCF